MGSALRVTCSLLCCAGYKGYNVEINEEEDDKNERFVQKGDFIGVRSYRRK